MAVRLLNSPVARDLISCGNVFKPGRWGTLSRRLVEAIGDSSAVVYLCTRTMSTQTVTKTREKCVTMENMNENLIRLEYAVRGPLVIRATEIEKELQQGVEKPFKEVLKANIGDCHAMGQKPITFIRQGDCPLKTPLFLHPFLTGCLLLVAIIAAAFPVIRSSSSFLELATSRKTLSAYHFYRSKGGSTAVRVLALVSLPSLMEDPRFPSDVKGRAQLILEGCKGGSVGSYTDSVGIEIIRNHVAKFIERRDGIPSDPLNIILSAGASDGIKNILKMLNQTVNGKRPGIMIPIPQYPLYSATLAEFNMQQVGYYLDEASGWGMAVTELERSIEEAKKMCNPRGIVIINPGNPTGQVLSRENIEEIIKFAYKHNLFLLADEVYQDNVYAEGSKFFSFKKVLIEMGPPYCDMELASFMSCSKGYMGECGLRGAYCEVINICPHVKVHLLKAISAMLCPTVLGQAVVECITNPPQPGEPSYDLFIKEKQGVLAELKKRARMVADTFNSIPGMSCNEVQGAMYAFPQITFPQKAIEAAAKEKKPADTFYAFQLLENTGICIVPGSGFGQKPGTYHFRTTILPQTDKLQAMLETFRNFHSKFVKQYS